MKYYHEIISPKYYILITMLMVYISMVHLAFDRTCKSRIPAQFRAVVTRSRLQETQWRPDRGVVGVVEGGNKDRHRAWKDGVRSYKKRVEAQRERVWLVIGLQSGSPRGLTKWPGQIALRLREYLYIQQRSQVSRVFWDLVSDHRTSLCLKACIVSTNDSDKSLHT